MKWFGRGRGTATATRADDRAEQATRVVRQAASWCLSYPDHELLDRVPVLRAALAEHGVDTFDAFLDHLEATPLAQLESQYVEVFDLTRRHALHLSYWTDGDTRRRGEVLAGFKATYREHDFLVDTGGELPDHLTLVLEFAALVSPEQGQELLVEYRPGIELLRLNLETDRLPYARLWGQVVAAVCATLPGASPATRAEAYAMAGPPPTETVGLDAYDPRLLPLAEGQ